VATVSQYNGKEKQRERVKESGEKEIKGRGVGRGK